jgi:ribosomal protein S18 acetylase RimI-like enzyme
MQVSLVEVVDARSADVLWRLYRSSFQPLRTVAAQRHLLKRDEFDDVLRDKRVVKHVVTDDDDDRACGLMAMTNDLAAVPLVSPDYFRARWPEHYEDGRIWYITLMAVDPAYQGSPAIGHLIGSGCATAAAAGGVIAADICEANEQALRLPTTIGRLARTYTPGVRTRRLDAQVYWAYEFPAPAPAPAGCR